VTGTSASLLAGLQGADPEAWRRLAHLYGPVVYGWCRRRGLPPPDCEDVLQEVFKTVAQKVAGFRRDKEGDTFRGWLWVITRNKIGDWIRDQQTRESAFGGTEAHQRIQELAEPPEPDAEPEGEPEVGALYQRALDLAREEFAEPTWQAFWRIVVEGQSPADVAADLGLSRNAVYIAKSRVLCRLRELLGEEERAGS
jgi:RNA polymerase sigma-70 factor (ECF subfamily)